MEGPTPAMESPMILREAIKSAGQESYGKFSAFRPIVPEKFC